MGLLAGRIFGAAGIWARNIISSSRLVPSARKAKSLRRQVDMVDLCELRSSRGLFYACQLEKLVFSASFA